MILISKLDLPIKAIEELCQLYKVHELAMFGSVLTDRFSEKSDIDLLVEFKPEVKIGLIKFIQFQHELSALIARPVDLVPKAGLKPLIRQSVLDSAQVLYAA